METSKPGVEILRAQPVDVFRVGVELHRFEIGHVFAMCVGPALFDVHRRIAFPLAITAVVIGRGEDHGLIRPQSGETIIAPVGGELRREFGVIFLKTHVTASVFEFSDNHFSLLVLSERRLIAKVMRLNASPVRLVPRLALLRAR